MVRPQGQDQSQQRRRLTMGPNKHWTDKFKSKSSSGSNSAAFPSVLADGSEERTLEPKLRWNPRPEQIRLLETIFSSGMVKPPRDEISKIRAQLQEYGQVEDANVFYWFQNRRSRRKQKNSQQTSATKSTSRRPLLARSPSSSSSDRSTSNGVRSGGLPELSKNSSSSSMNQNYIPNNQYDQYLNLQANQVQMQAPPPNYYPNQQTVEIATGVFGGSQTSGFRFNEIMGGGGSAGGSSSQMESFSRMLLGERMMAGHSSATVAGGVQRRTIFEDEVQPTLNFMNTNPINTTQAINVPPPPASNFQIPSTSQVQVQSVGGVGMVGPPRSTATVLINGLEVKVSAVQPFFVQETFGEDAVLFYQSGHPVPTDNRGATLHPLKHGASYILNSSPPPRPPAAAAPNQFPFN